MMGSGNREHTFLRNHGQVPEESYGASRDERPFTLVWRDFFLELADSKKEDCCDYGRMALEFTRFVFRQSKFQHALEGWTDSHFDKLEKRNQGSAIRTSYSLNPGFFAQKAQL